MCILFQEKFFVIVDFFFLLKGWTLFLGHVIVNVSNVVAFGGLSLVMTLAGHRLLGVLSDERSVHIATRLPEVGLHWLHLWINLLWIHPLIKRPIRATKTLILLRHKTILNVVIFRVFTIFLSVKFWFLDV